MAVISISRQFGAGGKYLSERLSERFNYKFADEELVARIAKEAGVSDEWVKVTEREGLKGSKGFVSSLFSSRFIGNLLGSSGGSGDEAGMVELFKTLVPEIASRDNVIFLGRGSQFLLQSNRDTIKVLLVATYDFRIKFMMEHYNLTRSDAEDAVKEWETNRLSFLRQLTDKDPNDPSIYDLTINTSVVRPHWAVAMVVELIQARLNGTSSR
jgi:cytidylate kinase